MVQGSPQVSTSAQMTPAVGVPQMLFLNQVTVNGQTSFVLVDANNKPVQLPQGKVAGYTNVILCKQILKLHRGKYTGIYIKKRVIEANIVKSTYIIEKEWDLICVQWFDGMC